MQGQARSGPPGSQPLAPRVAAWLLEVAGVSTRASPLSSCSSAPHLPALALPSPPLVRRASRGSPALCLSPSGQDTLGVGSSPVSREDLGGRDGPQCCLPGLLVASHLVPGGLPSRTETVGRALVSAWLARSPKPHHNLVFKQCPHPRLTGGDTEPQGFSTCSSPPSC